MKKWLIVPIALSLLCLSGSLSAASSAESLLAGTWSGSFQAGRYDPLELVFHIRRGEDGLSAVLDIPSQHRSGIPVDSVSLTGERLIITIPQIQAEFHGYVTRGAQNEGIRQINGDWSQSGEFVPLTLHPQSTGQ